MNITDEKIDSVSHRAVLESVESKTLTDKEKELVRVGFAAGAKWYKHKVCTVDDTINMKISDHG